MSFQRVLPTPSPSPAANSLVKDYDFFGCIDFFDLKKFSTYQKIFILNRLSDTEAKYINVEILIQEKLVSQNTLREIRSCNFYIEERTRIIRYIIMYCYQQFSLEKSTID